MCVIGTGWMNSMYGLLAVCVIFPGSVDVDGLAMLPVSDGESFRLSPCA